MYFRYFIDTSTEHVYMSIIDFLTALKVAVKLDFFNINDFNLNEYQQLYSPTTERWNDMNWIVPGTN